MVNIYLVGFMGSGKTSVGRLLAQHLGARFFDLDDRLREHFGREIHEVFADQGEASFRAAETAELRLAATQDGLVVATGGGAFADAANRQIIDQSGGLSVYFDLPWAVLQKRLERDNAGRPMYRSEDQARRLFDERVPHYRRATLTIGLTGDETPDEIVHTTADAVREAPCAT